MLAIASYLVGAIPFGLLIAKAKGIDIRTVGSKNIGATNVFRSVGKGPGLLAFICDALKGYIPAAFFPLLLERVSGLQLPNGALLCGISAVVGHTFPIYLNFKGGKGVATSAGMLLAIAPAVVGISLGAWIILLLTTRYVSIASIGAALVMGILVWLYTGNGAVANLVTKIVLSFLAITVILLHHANISRLCKGTENRFSFTKAQKAREDERRKRMSK